MDDESIAAIGSMTITWLYGSWLRMHGYSVLYFLNVHVFHTILYLLATSEHDFAFWTGHRKQKQRQVM